MTAEFTRYESAVTAHSFTTTMKALPDALLMRDAGEIKTYYAPFDYVNREAKIVICGITPGLQQARNALIRARLLMEQNLETPEVLRITKEVASFSGPMRNSLIAMLDHVGLADWLNLPTCARLFDSHAHLVHYTSALRYPVFRHGKNYGGSPSMLRHPSLRAQIDQYLAEEIRALPTSVFVPLGPRVCEVFKYLAERGVVRPERVLPGILHPSTQNNVRIKYFLGQTPITGIESQVNKARADAAKAYLIQRVKELTRQ